MKNNTISNSIANSISDSIFLPPQHSAHMQEIDAAGRRLAQHLSQHCGELPHDVAQRLRVARTQALTLRKPEAGLRLPVLSSGQRLALSGGVSEGLGLWSVLGSALPLLALLAGLVLVQWFDREQTVSDLAQIDTALLLDDLPPAAYSDPVFIQFLRQNANSPTEQD